MALTAVSTVDKLTARRTDQVFDSHKHSEKSTDLNADALSSALQSALKKSRAPTPSTRIRSPTLPLDEDADGETDQWTGNKKSMSTSTPGLQKEKSKARSVLKPVSSRVSKQPSNQRSRRRRIPRKQHGAKYLGENAGDTQNPRQEKSQDSNLSSTTTTLPTHQVDQPGNLNSQPISPDRQVQPRRASIALHPESAQQATRRRRAPKSKLSTKINVESSASSMVHKRRRQNPAQEVQNFKLKNRQQFSQEFKTKSGRVSKRPERLEFT
ncbi:MAG: hypothetical protein M1836_003718 [Candelina mexicana]|nr:MAG: hypothetical protein M1836_003718 [Candelina mexicana]